MNDRKKRTKLVVYERLTNEMEKCWTCPSVDQYQQGGGSFAREHNRNCQLLQNKINQSSNLWWCFAPPLDARLLGCPWKAAVLWVCFIRKTGSCLYCWWTWPDRFSSISIVPLSNPTTYTLFYSCKYPPIYMSWVVPVFMFQNITFLTQIFWHFAVFCL